MARADEIPVGKDFREAWSALDGDQRRRVRRAVSRGHALTSRREARLAVAFARTQQRFWRWSWLLGPMVVFGLTYFDGGLVAAIVNTALVLVIVGLVSLMFFTRARRAEAANLAVLTRRRKGKGKGYGRAAS